MKAKLINTATGDVLANIKYRKTPSCDKTQKKSNGFDDCKCVKRVLKWLNENQ